MNLTSRSRFPTLSKCPDRKPRLVTCIELNALPEKLLTSLTHPYVFNRPVDEITALVAGYATIYRMSAIAASPGIAKYHHSRRIDYINLLKPISPSCYGVKVVFANGLFLVELVG